jgi:hypothetical protein
MCTARAKTIARKYLKLTLPGTISQSKVAHAPGAATACASSRALPSGACDNFAQQNGRLKIQINY